MAKTTERRRGDVVRGQITALTFEGQGVARIEGMALFVRGVVPGDLADVRLTRIKKNYAEGEAIAIVQPSPSRVQPLCPHFGVCGGCASQDLDYQQQLVHKTQQVKDSLEHIGGLQVEVRPALGMDVPWHYRNKMEFAFGQQDEKVHLGLMRRGCYDEVAEISECLLTTPRAMAAVRATEEYVNGLGLTAYRPKPRTGVLRHLVVREGLRSGDLLLNLVTTSGVEPAADLAAAVAGVAPTTVLWSINDTWGSVVQGDRVQVLSGPGEITERFGHLTLRAGPFSFMQTNSQMSEVLYNEVARQAALTGRERVLDLFCGAGAIALYLARGAGHVTGVDIVPEAIALAGRNAEANGIANADFQRAPVEALSTLSLGAIDPDVIVVDPPRAGLHPKLVATLGELRAPHIVYVSCNPASLARDLKALAGVYAVGPVQPVDMFPHTWHIESVVRLDRR